MGPYSNGVKMAASFKSVMTSQVCSLSKKAFPRYSALRLLSYDSQAKEKNTHFGYERVTEEEKTEKVYKVFESVADSYDVMNDVMSIGIHRLWKDKFVKKLNPDHRTRLLDVAGGTGDIAFRFINHVRQRSRHRSRNSDHTAHVTVCDINKSMLSVGRRRAERMKLNSEISWIAGNAENLPVKDASFDAYTIAFGIRNVTRVDKALREAHRVLVPGGRFLCLEFSKVENPALEWLYKKYSFEVIPVMGEVIAQDWRSYQYLVESIRQFPDQEEFTTMIKAAGFSCVSFENLSCGIAAIHSGFKL